MVTFPAISYGLWNWKWKFLLKQFTLNFQDKISTINNSSYFLCKSECLNHFGCKWYSYSRTYRRCFLYPHCSEKNHNTHWVTNQKDCNNYQCFVPMIRCNKVCFFILLKFSFHKWKHSLFIWNLIMSFLLSKMSTFQCRLH